MATACAPALTEEGFARNLSKRPIPPVCTPVCDWDMAFVDTFDCAHKADIVDTSDHQNDKSA